MKDLEVLQINKGTYFGSASGSIIEVTKEAVEPDAVLKYDVGIKKWASWGPYNDRPQKVVDENMQDGTSAGALRFKRQAHYGAGLMYYRKQIDGKGKETIIPVQMEELPPEMEDFHFYNDLENTIQKIITDYEWWNMYHLQYIPNKAGNKIVQINHLRTIDLRPEKRDRKTGEIMAYYASRYWPDPQGGEYVRLPAFDRMDPFKSPNAVYRHVLVSVDKDYYITPEWQSNLKWLAVAKKIPEWINANIENSINLKWHIRIPEDYFTALHPQGNYDSDEEWKKAIKTEKETLFKKMDDMLAGAKHASKTFYSTFAIDETGNKMPGWEIDALKADLNDQGWLNAYGTGAAAIATAHGVPPSLQGLILSNGLGTGSASDTREQFNYYLQLNTVIPRQTTLEWFQLIKRYNKWPRDLHLGYKNIVLQSLDQNKSGFAAQNEPAPTTQNKNGTDNDDSGTEEPDSD